MIYRHLYKLDVKTGKEWDYGWLSEKDIKAQTRGYKFDKKAECYTRRGSRYGYYTMGKSKR